MIWISILIWMASCAGAVAFAFKKWILPCREGNRVSWVQLLLAAAGGALGCWLLGMGGSPIYQLRALLALSLCGMAAAVDWDQRKIPNGCTLSLAVSGLVLLVLEHFLEPETAPGMLLSALVGGFGLLVCLSFCRLITRGGIGIGDIKLVSAAGFLIGMTRGFSALLMGQVAAVAAALILLLTRRAGWKDSMPFAPFFWLGLLLSLAF